MFPSEKTRVLQTKRGVTIKTCPLQNASEVLQATLTLKYSVKSRSHKVKRMLVYQLLSLYNGPR